MSGGSLKPSGEEVFSFVLTLVAWYFSRAEISGQMSYFLGGLSFLIGIREIAFPAWILSKRLAKTVQELEEWLYGRMRKRSHEV